MIPYSPKSRPLSWKQRSENAAAKEQARLDNWNDPYKMAIRRVQTALRFEHEAVHEAAKQFEQDHAAVICAYTGAEIHPQRAAAIAKLAMQEGWSTVRSEPVAPFKSLDAMKAEFSEKATAEFHAANAALAAMEAGEDPADDEVEPVPVKGRARS